MPRRPTLTNYRQRQATRDRRQQLASKFQSAATHSGQQLASEALSAITPPPPSVKNVRPDQSRSYQRVTAHLPVLQTPRCAFIARRQLVSPLDVANLDTSSSLPKSPAENQSSSDDDGQVILHEFGLNACIRRSPIMEEDQVLQCSFVNIYNKPCEGEVVKLKDCLIALSNSKYLASMKLSCFGGLTERLMILTRARKEGFDETVFPDPAICFLHREELGVRWRRFNKKECEYPGHNSRAEKGRHMNYQMYLDLQAWHPGLIPPPIGANICHVCRTEHNVKKFGKRTKKSPMKSKTGNMDDIIMIEEDDKVIDLDNEEDLETLLDKAKSGDPSADIDSIMSHSEVQRAKLPFNDLKDLDSFLDDKFKKLDIDSMIDKALDSLSTKIRTQERLKLSVNRIFSDCEDALLRAERDIDQLQHKEINIPSGSDSDDDIQIIEATNVARKRTAPKPAAPVPPTTQNSSQPQYKLIVNNSTGQAILQPIGGASMLSRQEMVSILSQTNLMNQVKHLQQAPPMPVPADQMAQQQQPSHVHQRKQQFPPMAANANVQQPRAQTQAQRPALQYNQLQHKQIDLAVGMKLFGKKNNEIWYKGTLLDIYDREKPITERKYKLKFDGKGMKILDGKSIALGYEPSNILPVGSRIIALYKDEMASPTFYAGIAAESPSFRNFNRYLIFFDDGYAQYCHPSEVRKVVEQSRNVWDDVHPDSQEFIRKYLHQYPERPMVKLQRGQRVKTEWNGIWWTAFVEQVDASLVKMYFDADKRTEMIYRGSTRLEPLYTELANAEVSKQGGKGARRHHGAGAKSTKAPYVEYLRNYEDDVQIIEDGSTGLPRQQQQRQQQGGAQFQNLLRQMSSPQKFQQFGTVPAEMFKKAPTARKSTAASQQVAKPLPPKSKNVQGHITGRDIESILLERLGNVGTDEESFGAMKEINRKNFPQSNDRNRYKQHACGPKCLKDVCDDPVKFKGNNPLLIPMLCGWERQVARQGNTGRRVIFYRTPCGRRLRTIEETDRYLMATDSQLTIDLFCYDPSLSTHCEFVPVKTFCDIKDLSYGKEAVPISCVNGIDRQYPDYVQYSNQRMPGKGVHLNTNTEYLCGCDCTDGCRDPTKCKCIQMSIAAKRAAAGMSHKPDSEVGYKYRRLVDQLITGIYECNPQCGCDNRCHNRVAQNSLALRLQVFKTEKRGWGLRCLDDIPAGGFICIYAGQLLTEQGANEDGQQYGDEYLAELDYIEVVEKMKDGYESDVEDPDKEEDSSSSEEEEEEQEVAAEEERRESDSDSNFSLHEHMGLRKRRRVGKDENPDTVGKLVLKRQNSSAGRQDSWAVKARPLSSQQKTQQWLHNLPPNMVHHGQHMHGAVQPTTVRSLLARAGMPANSPKKVSQDAMIVISDEEDMEQFDGQNDDKNDSLETPYVTIDTDFSGIGPSVEVSFVDSDKAFDSVDFSNVKESMFVDFDKASDLDSTESDSLNSWKVEQYDGPLDVEIKKRKTETESSQSKNIRHFDQFSLTQFDGPPDDEQKDSDSDKESIKSEKLQEEIETKETAEGEETKEEEEIKEEKKEVIITPKSEEEELDDLETDLPDECLLNTAEDKEDDFFTDKSQDSGDETHGIANLTITEPTSLNIDQIIADLEDDEEDTENNVGGFKRTTRSQTSRFQNLPNPEEAAKQKLEDYNQKKAGITTEGVKPGYPKVRSYRDMLSEDFCYVMDAKSMGNLGRYLNHSCAPNVFVQNVFVDTHDLRFPWVAFFAAQYIRAGTELTWDYNYEVGSVPGKVLYCYCGAVECRGRLL